jgi:acyl carrier protein
VGVLRTDWRHLSKLADTGRLAPLFSELLADVRRAAPAAARHTAGAAMEVRLRDRLLAAMPNRRKALLRDFVRAQTIKVLGLEHTDELDINEPLRQLGLDSLMAVELRNLLGKAVERSLPATLTFDHPTVAALVEHLAGAAFADELRDTDAAAATAVSAPSAETFDELSADELMAQLESRLDLIAMQEKI